MPSSREKDGLSLEPVCGRSQPISSCGAVNWGPMKGDLQVRQSSREGPEPRHRPHLLSVTPPRAAVLIAGRELGFRAHPATKENTSGNNHRLQTTSASLGFVCIQL